MRLLGITLPDEKRLEIALTVVYGIGRKKAKEILVNAKVDHGKKAKDVTQAEETKIRNEVEKLKLEGDLKREISGNIKRLKDIQAYRGSRHAKRLPSRGQRSKTNSRTVRGNVRKTMGSGKRSVEKK
ncbi:30S ribosomal protein S13 [Candidatus Parcubacteria bacterium]|nr:30S ribosomal protein S13 [Candidatus Parcubacteria bacterium]